MKCDTRNTRTKITYFCENTILDCEYTYLPIFQSVLYRSEQKRTPLFDLYSSHRSTDPPYNFMMTNNISNLNV